MLHAVRVVERHVVAQVVKAKFIVRAVGDVGGVGPPAAGKIYPVGDEPDLKAEEAINLSHPLTVQPRQVVVNGNDMHPTARQGIEVGRERRDKGLAFAGLHLGDAPLVQDHAPQ